MTKTTNTVLVIGVVLIVLIVVMKSMQPKRVGNTSGTNTSTLGGLLSLGGAIIGKLGTVQAPSNGANLSSGDKEILGTVTDDSGAVDLSGVYDPDKEYAT
jgi:hypothetical protein